MTAIHRYRYFLILIVALSLFVWLGLTRNLGAGRDDVFITLYAGQALANGQGIVNYNGDRVEMSSSLLHTFVIAAIDFFAPNYVFTLNKLVGGACGALVLVVLYAGRGVLFRTGRLRFVAFGATMLLTATNPAIVYWCFGGLETPFAALFFSVYAVCLLHHRFKPTPTNEAGVIGAQCFYVLTRPEGFFLLLFTGVYLALMHFFGRRPYRWRILLAPATLFAGVTLFRLMYFGAPLPNTVFAKSGGLAEGVLNGFVYFRYFYNAGAFLSIALAVQIILLLWYARVLILAATKYPLRMPLPLANILLFGLVLAAQLVVLLAGGDWMEHFRFLVPILPLLIALAITAIAAGIGAFRRAFNTPRTALAACLLLSAAATAVNVRQSGLNVPRPLPRENIGMVRDYELRDLLDAGAEIDLAMMRINNDHRRDLELLVPFFEEVLPGLDARSNGLVVATGQMGFFPYWIKRKYPEIDIEFVDTLGLCDRTVAHMPLKKDHTGVADGRYVDEILDGQVPLLSDYVNAKSPNVVYFLGYDPAVEDRLLTYAEHGFLPVWKKVGAMVLYKERNSS